MHAQCDYMANHVVYTMSATFAEHGAATHHRRLMGETESDFDFHSLPNVGKWEPNPDDQGFSTYEHLGTPWSRHLLSDHAASAKVISGANFLGVTTGQSKSGEDTETYTRRMKFKGTYTVKVETSAELHHNLDLHHAEEYIATTSIVIVYIFAVEICILLVALGFSFFFHPFYVLDLFVVGGTIFLQAWFVGEPADNFLNLLRLWRFVRIIHGVYADVYEGKHSAMAAHHERVKIERENDFKEFFNVQAQDWAMNYKKKHLDKLESDEEKSKLLEEMRKRGVAAEMFAHLLEQEKLQAAEQGLADKSGKLLQMMNDEEMRNKIKQRMKILSDSSDETSSDASDAHRRNKTTVRNTRREQLNKMVHQ